MDSRNEILDSIEIIVNKAMEGTTKIQNGNVVGVSGNVCTIEINGRTFTDIPFYGNIPVINKQYRVFIPEGNMSRAFIYTMQGSSGSSLVKLDYVRPEDFGAVGDGVTDDTDSFRKAMSNMYQNGLDTVKLRNKRYYLKNLEVDKSIKFIGEQGTVITGDGGYPCVVADYRSPRRTKVSSLSVDGIKTTFKVDDIPQDVKRGDIIKVYANGSNDKVPNIRFNSHIGEFLSIYDVDRDNNSVIVFQKLRYDYKPEDGHTYLTICSKKSIEISNLSIDIQNDSTTQNNVGVFEIRGWNLP